MKKFHKFVIMLISSVVLMTQFTMGIKADGNDNVVTEVPLVEVDDVEDKIENNETNRALTTVFVEYVNEEGENIGYDHFQTGSDFVAYHPKDVHGYVTPGFVNVDLGGGLQYLTVIYQRDIFEVRINAVDVHGKIVGWNVYKGEYGSTQTIELESPFGYTPSVTSIDHTFLDNETVDVLYNPNPYTVSFEIYDAEDNTLIGSTATSGSYFEKVAINFPDIPGYERNVESIDYVILRDDVINIKYQRKDVMIRIKYVLEDGTVIEEDSIIDKYKAPYEITLRDFDDYEVSTIDDNGLGSIGTMPHEDIEYIVHLKNKGIKNTVQYTNDLGEVVHEVEVSGDYGDNVIVNLPEIPGYEITSLEDNVEIGNPNSNQVSELVYKRKNIKIKVRYILPDNTVLGNQELSGLYRDAYKVLLETYNGYEIESINLNDNNLEGLFPTEDGVIDVHLEPITITKKIVYYNDFGEVMYETEVSGTYMESVNVEIPYIQGYNTSVQNETIVFNTFDESYKSEIIYERCEVKLIVEYKTLKGEIIKTESESYRYRDEYNIHITKIDGYEVLQVDRWFNLSGDMPYDELVIHIFVQAIEDKDMEEEITDPIKNPDPKEPIKELEDDEEQTGSQIDNQTNNEQTVTEAKKNPAEPNDVSKELPATGLNSSQMTELGLVLMVCGIWFNIRNWNAKKRTRNYLH